MAINSTEVPALKIFYVYLTSGCNCACRHCYFISEHATQGDPGKVLVPKLLRHAIEQALPLGLSRLKWTGGEPTLHPDFISLLQLQEEFGLAGSLETNGLLIDASLVACMMKTGVDQISVSLDGAQPETHNRIRGINDGFHRTIMGIRALTDAGYRPELILTLQRDNVSELDEYLALASELGAGAVKLNVLQPFLRGAELSTKGGAIGVNEVISIAEKLNSMSAEYADLPVVIDVPLAFRPLAKILSGEQDGVCNLLHVLGLLPSGEYALCGVGQHIGDLAMGQVTTHPLAEVWQESPLLQSLRAGLPRDLRGICGDCLMRGACKGGCIAANYQVGGDLFAPYWFCQQAMSMGIFPSSRLEN